MDYHEKQKYFEFDPSAGGKWWNKEVPSAPPSFQEGLNRIAGLEDGKYPRLRLVWGGNQLHDYTEKPQLKYQRLAETITGYDYIKKDGEVGYTKSMNLATDAKEPWEFQPHKERIALGWLRWIVEKHVTAEECRKLGRFTNCYGVGGEKILRDLPPEGVYDTFLVIQTAARKYRDPDPQVLAAVEAMYHYDMNASDAQKTLDLIELNNNQTLIGANEAQQIWQGL
jgi:hypothetical protein